MKIARVFPRRTKATPDDDMAFIGDPPLFPVECDEVHVSCTFTWDLPEAHRMCRAWSHIAPVRLGGPATGMRGEDFVPGLYVKRGYIITSRGCPNNCWFCSVPKRDGGIRELPVTEGWNVLDDNILACSPEHFLSVIEMLSWQKRSAEFTGGLEAARFNEAHAVALSLIKPKQMFFAYDTPNDWEPLVKAAAMCWKFGFTPASHAVRAYVLIGWPGDAFDYAASRLENVLKLGITPMAMLYRFGDGKVDPTWRRFQRKWARPAMIHGRHLLPLPAEGEG